MMRWKIGWWKTWVLSLSLAIASLATGLPVRAAKTASTTNFEMTPLLPKNQVNSRDSYFNLQVKPGAVQKLAIAVSNPSQQTKHLLIEPVNATTTDAGSAVYVPSNRSDPSAKVTFKQLTSPGVTVTLALHQAKTVAFKTQVPKDGFEGEILGGLFVTDTQSQGAKPKTKNGFALANRYAEVAAVALWIHPQQPVAVQLAFGGARVVTQNQQPQVQMKIRNLAPILFGQLHVNAQIQNQAGKAVATQTLKQGSMAPNSWFNYGVSLGSRTLTAGKYTLTLKLSSGQRHWRVQRAFTLSPQRTQQHNHRIKASRPVNWWLWGTLAVIAILIGLIAAYWSGRRRTKKEAVK